MEPGTEQPPKRLRLVAYLRVSTDRQAEHGQGLDIQERAIRRWARAQDHRIVEVLRDEGVSGSKDAADRPGLTAALDLVERHKADGVVVYRLDRLARSLTVQEAVLGHVWRHSGRVFAVDTGEVPQDDPSDPMRTFVRQVMGAAHQLERGLIAARMRAGRELKAERGGYAGFGSPPFGMRAEAKELVPVADEQAAIRRIVELRGQGRSLPEIVEVLEAERLRSKRGGRWHPQTVSRVLQRVA
ncbi:MAG: recombinase family protein [Acidimicrobiales bacterium]